MFALFFFWKGILERSEETHTTSREGDQWDACARRMGYKDNFGIRDSASSSDIPCTANEELFWHLQFL